MPIISTDIVYRLSGGSGNTDPNASLGGGEVQHSYWGRFT